MRRACAPMAKGDTSKGVAMLNEQGRVTEIADAKERIAAIVKDYAAKSKNTIIVSPDNASRREINQAVRLSFDPDKMRHIDHGYAVTSHSSQGTTASRVLVNIDTEAPRSLINTRLAYVSISRAADDARIYTNKAENLHEKLATEVTKTVAVEYSAKAREQAHAGYLGPKRSSDGSKPMPISRTAELRHAVAMLGGDEARIGVNLLEQQGRITVEPDRERRLAAMARDYAAAPEKAVAVVPSAGERRQVNELIRAELRRTGALGPDDQTVPVSVERQINRRNAGAYEVGDRIEFRAGSPEHGIQPNSSATVLAVNSEGNQLTIQKQDGEVATYNPSNLKASRQSKVYREESRELELGDRIRVTVDHKSSGIRAGDLATVEAIRGIGALQVRLDSGKLAELEPAQARHIEYGYAVESGQRVKADRLLASVESTAQLAVESPLFKAVQQSKDAAFYTPDRTALYEARMPDEIERFLTRTADAQQAFVPNLLLAPLESALGQAQASQFELLAETGPIQTYQHQETGRNLHIDRITGQFYDQGRNPIGKDAALAHALSDGPSHAKQEPSAENIGPVISQNQPSQGHRLRM